MSNTPDILTVTSPCDGAVIAELTTDNEQTLTYKINNAVKAQENWQNKLRDEREKLLVAFSNEINKNKQNLLDLIVYDAGKTAKEAESEVINAVDIFKKTIENSRLADFAGMIRYKERRPMGLVGLITSFNFPLAVAHWTIAPALLAGNAILWKPSEKTPLVAISIKEIFDNIAGEDSNLLQILIGDREIGSKLVSHEQIDFISATGSVTMGHEIANAIKQKKNSLYTPILELGGNNGVIISDKITTEHLEWSVDAIMGSFLATNGQRCTNTRRLIVQHKIYDEVVALVKQKTQNFIASGAIVNPLSGISNDYGYSVLIDGNSFKNFETAKKRAIKQGGEIHFGERLLIHEHTNVFFVEPAIALMPMQSPIMHLETFAPILFITKYNKFDEAIDLVNAPSNAGLVNGIYTQNTQEADLFILKSESGHTLVNPPKGTTNPAFGMGFGGNKNSGMGEVLNHVDPLKAFSSIVHNRIAINSAITMNL